MPDEPIVVTGGSVSIDFGDAYQPDQGQPGKKKFKSNNVKLDSIEVNGQKVVDLKPNDVVTIVCR
ncbi:MAG: hypothetical protein ACJ74W_12135 [Pyrinomonadaceae bacterium]